MAFNSETAAAAGKKSSRKGIPNNTRTAELKSFYLTLLSGQQSKIEKELQKLTGKDYLTAIFKLSEYVLPKQRSIEQTIDLSKLTNAEIDELLKRVTDESE